LDSNATRQHQVSDFLSAYLWNDHNPYYMHDAVDIQVLENVVKGLLEEPAKAMKEKRTADESPNQHQQHSAKDLD